MGKVIGIDLGTTNSCISFVESGEPKVIINEDMRYNNLTVLSDLVELINRDNRDWWNILVICILIWSIL